MTKKTFLLVALVAALAAPVAYGLSTSPEVPPSVGQAPRAEGPRDERGPRRFREGAPESLPERARIEDRAGDELRGSERGERGERGVRGERGFRRERGVRGERGFHGEPGERGRERGVRGERGERGARFAEHLSTELGLTAEQAAQVQAVFESHRGARGANRDLPPEERRAAREARRAQIDAELAQILTPEQQTRFTELRAERRERFEAREGRRTRGEAESRYRGGVDNRGI
jgi:Spy/CpxP family protein refolding chaperone